MSGQSSHMMRTTRRGRPFLKDTGDLYSTLILSLPLENRRHFFKSYPNAFTTDEAAANLASLKFSQSSRAADPKDPTRIITTTTTTTFSMSREMAKGICQHFMDARLIENASDISSRTFKDRGVYISTSKGLHVLERFMTKNGISSESVVKCFQKQPVCMKLLHLERRSADDDIIITRSVIEVLFRRMLGREPHVSTLSVEDLDAMKASRWFAKTATTPDVKEEEFDQADGMIIRKNMLNPNEKRAYDEYTFKAFDAVDWIMEYTSCVCVEEAAEVGAQMVRYGFMALAQDKSKIKEGNFIAHAKGGGAGGAQQAQLNDGEFRAADRAIYKITKEGFILLKWDVPGLVTRSSAAASKANLLADSASTVSKSTPSRSSHSTDDVHSVTGTPVARIRGGGTKEHLRAEFADSPHGQQAAADKDHSSHTAKLKQILDEPALRSLFREFLRANYCEENLSFWLDVQDFKKKFATTSSVANPDANKNRVGHAAMEKHQQELISMGFVIYNTYLAPASPAELNIDHNLRAELITHMNQINADKEAGVKGSVEPGVGNTLHASQLQILIRLYERIQAYIYRLMATDSVPKFCKTERYLQLMKSMFDYNEKYLDYDATDQKLVVQDEDDSPSRAYLTISQAANEKFAAKIQAEDEEMKKMSRGYRG